MAHTPRPWAINKINPWTINYLQFEEPLDDRNVVCRMPNRNPETEANARLITAAPEMLKCLQAIVARIHGVYDDPALIEWGGLHHNSDQDILKHAKKLITKATGEQP